MMRNLLTLFILMFGLGLQAQLVFSPDEPIGFGTSDMNEVQVDITVTNTGNTEETFYWQVDMLEGADVWKIVVCDNNLCYSPGIVSCPCSDPNILGAGATMTFMVKIKPSSVAGDGVLELAVTSDCAGTDQLFTTPIEYEIAMPSSVEDDLFIANMNLYPNPAQDYFQLSNDDNVAKVSIHSIVGSEINVFTHSPNQAYSTGNLNSGIYLVRAYDADGNVLKAMRLSKR